MTYTVEKTPQVSRKVTPPSYAMIALTLIGIADAAYVARGNYTGAPLWCPILDGCNTVINSPYSRVFGVPMSYFGFIYYVFFMFGLAARLVYEPFSNNLRFRAILLRRVRRRFFRFTSCIFKLVLFVQFAATSPHLFCNVILPPIRCPLALSSDPSPGDKIKKRIVRTPARGLASSRQEMSSEPHKN